MTVQVAARRAITNFIVVIPNQFFNIVISRIHAGSIIIFFCIDILTPSSFHRSTNLVGGLPDQILTLIWVQIKKWKKEVIMKSVVRIRWRR